MKMHTELLWQQRQCLLLFDEVKRLSHVNWHDAGMHADMCTRQYTDMEDLGRTHIMQSVLCLSTFDPQSPVCLINVSTPYRFVGPGTVGRGGLWHRVDVHARAQARSADIAVTVCGGFTVNSGRQQHTNSG